MGTSLATDNTLFIALMGNPTFYDRFLTYMGGMLATEWTSGRIVEMIRERYEALDTRTAAPAGTLGAEPGEL